MGQFGRRPSQISACEQGPLALSRAQPAGEHEGGIREGGRPPSDRAPAGFRLVALRVQDHTFASGTLVQTQPRPSTLHGDCLSDQLVLLQSPPPHSVLSILWSKEQHANTQGQARAHGKAAGGELPHGMLLLLEQ